MVRRMEIDIEWDRVRLAPGVLACSRYSWLRSVDPRRVRFGTGDERAIGCEARTKAGRNRRRALRVDEAMAVLDVHFALADVHPMDRRVHMLRFFYEPSVMILRRHSLHPCVVIHLRCTRQRVGVRFWWACPRCGRQCRLLYHFSVRGEGNMIHVLGCRSCLGLTYASRSRHRCADGDVAAARRGDAGALQRVEKRAQRRLLRDEALAAEGEERRRRLLQQWRRVLVS